jgi:predicted metal-dependent HD superfamily phosphohydrolase
MEPADVRAALGPLPTGFALSDAAWSRICAGYHEPHRHYHDFAHVLEVRAQFASVAEHVGWIDAREVFAAVLYHDVVYEIAAADNEARSAEIARADVADAMVDASADRVAELIELTARHGSLSPPDIDAEAALFLDCDMAILGASPERYDAYAAGVRAEYTQKVPADAYDQGRAAFLSRCLEKPRIYLSDHYFARLEAAARDNIRRELAICSAAKLR